MPLKKSKKIVYYQRMQKLLQENEKIMIIGVDNVGSKQFADVRYALRGKARILMGKNTMIRSCIKTLVDKMPQLENLTPLVKLNVGFVFCEADMNEVRKIITQNKVPAAAKTGALAPISVVIPAGNSGLDPAQTSFFQALNIGTKIVKGQIEIVTDVDLIHAGNRVTASQAALLQKLNICPFTYGIEVLHIYDSGNVYNPAVLDISDEDMVDKFGDAVNHMAAFSRQVGIPTLAGLPHMIMEGFKNLAALGLETDVIFPQMASLKDALDNPNAVAVPVAAAGGAKEEKAAPVVEEEEEEEEEMGFDLFD